MRRSSGFLLAACRTRSAACDTLARLCVRHVLWPSRFPLAGVLPSRASADARASLFGTFLGVGSEEAPRRAGLRPPLKRPVRFSRKPLSQRCLIEGSRKEPNRAGVRVRTRRAAGAPAAVASRRGASTETMRPKPPNNPAVKLVEELADIGLATSRFFRFYTLSTSEWTFLSPAGLI